MSGAAAAVPAAAAKPGAVPLRDWIAVLGGVLGAFMAVLDIQITNASLADIQGSLGASLDEGSWISTGYLIAEIIVIPLTGWLAGVIGLRRYLLVNSALFLMFSMLCGTATSLSEMIIFRIGQGFTGGVLIPLAFTIILIKLPPAKRAIGSAMFGFSATFAPSIGPSIGGWLTDNYSWHWIFYINLIPGALLIAAIWYGLDKTAAKYERLWHGDWIGIAAMAAGLGCLEYVLEEGQRKDWFGNDTIRACAWISGISLVFFLAWELTRKEPFIDLRLFKRASFATATAVNFATGLALYGSVFVLPVYLASVQGYNALQIGEVQMWVGLPQLVLFPLVPLMLRYVDSRLLCAIGIVIFASSCLVNGETMSYYTGMDQLKVTQIIRALGQPLVMAPLSQMATLGIAPAQAGSASALFNMMRNLGGSVGIALMSTLAARRENFHFSVISDRLTHNSVRVAEWVGGVQQYVAPRGGDAHMQALGELAALVRREAFVMAYGDCFLVIGILLMLSVAGTPFMQRARPGGGGGGGH